MRTADSISKVFNESIYECPYDCILGTSDKGEVVEQADFSPFKNTKHALIFFGGLEGIEGLIETDESDNLTIQDIDQLFHKYVNTCPDQGSLTIRTEEAILISLAKIMPYLGV